MVDFSEICLLNFCIVKPHEGHGFEVPMHYLDRQLPPNLETEKILVTVPSYEHYYEWGKRYGEAYDRSDLRTAIIASSDLSHVLKPEGPYGYHSAGPLFDKLVVKAIKEKAIKYEENIFHLGIGHGGASG